MIVLHLFNCIALTCPNRTLQFMMDGEKGSVLKQCSLNANTLLCVTDCLVGFAKAHSIKL